MQDQSYGTHAYKYLRCHTRSSEWEEIRITMNEYKYLLSKTIEMN